VAKRKSEFQECLEERSDAFNAIDSRLRDALFFIARVKAFSSVRTPLAANTQRGTKAINKKSLFRINNS
jgi:hypothetical protein